MAWNSISPDGAISVKANTVPMQDNTTYTETTMNIDHFWNIGVNEDGRHKQVQMPVTVGDIALGAGMDGGMYLRETQTGSNARIQGFYRNVNGIFQFIPCYQTGSAVLSTSFTTLATIEDDSYGQIWLWNPNVLLANTTAYGYFKATNGRLDAITLSDYIVFGNEATASGLTIRAKTQGGGAVGTWEFRIMYWGMN